MTPVDAAATSPDPLESIEGIREALRDLLDRRAIWECLLRYARGVDRFDAELIRSAFHDDALDDHGKFVGDAAEFVEWAVGQHTHAHLGHLHNLFNHTCELDGDVAHTETYFMFAGMNREGRPLVLNGGRYLDRFERRDGEWRIAYRTLMRDWGMLTERPDPDDISSYTSNRDHLPAEVKAFLNQSAPSRRDRADLSYVRPLQLDPDRLVAWRDIAERLR